MTRTLYDLDGKDGCRFSPYGWRTKMALRHKGLDFEAPGVPFTAIPQLLDGSHKTVPVLEDDGTVVSDSFRIALYLEESYPDAPSLFAGRGGQAACRFFEQWTNTNVNAGAMPMIVADVAASVVPEDETYFRESREKRVGGSLEALQAGRDGRIADFRKMLTPVRNTLSLQPFLGGEAPLFQDYIVFGSLQWARVTSPFALLEADDPVYGWFERCLDLFDGYGRAMPAAGKAA